jgi:Zn-dependent M28 family amino/carboxypeptidase
MTSRLLGRSTVVALLSLMLALGATATSATTEAHTAQGQSPGGQVTISGIREHLEALQRIADRNGGNRLAGTPGYDASARYVAARMRAAGFQVRLQTLTFPFVVDRSPPSLRAVDATDWDYRAGRDYATLAYSGSGSVRAPLVAVDLVVPSPSENGSTSGCEHSDFAGFPRGAVALLQRGSCTFREKVANAIAAGAGAVVVFNDGSAGRRGLFTGTLGAPQVALPVLAASFDLGVELRNGIRNGPTGRTVTLETDVIAERRKARNVIAETRTGKTDRVVVVGAHLDSVSAGPGINDNGSGSAVVLEVAEVLAATRPRNRVRFVWWAAEEEGLLGSRHYVEDLSTAARRRIALYLNLDMVGSRNFVRYVYDGDGSASSSSSSLPAGSAAIERVFRRYFAARDLAVRETGMGGSDHQSFARAGIPVGGLFTGADGQKSAEDATAFGGRAAHPYDACYHRACDTLANVNGAVLTQVARAAAHAIQRFARDVSDVRRRG